MNEIGIKTARYDGVIFDMDGTLLEASIDFDGLRQVLGISLARGIIEQIDEMPEDRRAWARARLLEFELAGANAAMLNDGAEELIHKLRALRIPTALLTRNTRKSFDIVARRFDVMKNFDLVMCREDGLIKPEPDGIISACKKMGITPQRTLCVGDFEFDLLAARAAGAVGVLLTTHPHWQSYADKADRIIHSLREFWTVFNENDGTFLV